MPIQPHSRDRSSLFGTTLYMLIGPLLWALHMTAVYGAHTLICRLDVSEPALLGMSASAMFIAAATVLAVGIIAVFAIARNTAARLLRVQEAAALRRFIDGVMLWLGFLSAAGVVWSGATILVLDSCAQLR